MAFTGGAPAVVSEILAAAAAISADRTSLAAAAGQSVVGRLAGDRKTADYNDFGITARRPPATTTFFVSEDYRFSLQRLEATFGAATAQIATDLADALGTFLNQNFPSLNSYEAAIDAWMRAAESGGMATDRNVEDQGWARARAAILSDAASAATAESEKWAAKGFSLPPGMLVNGLVAADQIAQTKIAEASRTAATTTFDAELANVRLTVEQALKFRKEATDAALAYVLVRTTASTLGLGLAQNEELVRQHLSDIQLAFFRSAIAQKELDLKIMDADASLRWAKEKLDRTTRVTLDDMSVDTMLANAEQLATQAAAAINGLHGSASISGTDNTVMEI